MPKIFKTKFKVRGYELDAYGHVNNAVYLNYFEFARWCMLEEAGVGADYFKKNGVSPVIVRSEIDYRAACLLAEPLVIETYIESYRKKVVVFSQKIIKESSNVLAAEGKMTMVVINETGRAVALPSDFVQQFGE